MAKLKVDLVELLESGAYFGHQASRWNPKMKPYLYAVRDGVHVFDLVKTKEGLEKAMEFVRQTATSGGQIVFVGTKRQASAIIKEEAKRAGMPYVNVRWLGGTITNWEQIKKRLEKLAEMKEKRDKGEYKKYTKKEQLMLDREISRLERFFGGVTELKGIPATIFVVDSKKEITAVREAKAKGIPVVAMVDSNSDPDPIDYVIPANDDAVGSIKMIVSLVAEAAKEGRELFEKKNKASKLT